MHVSKVTDIQGSFEQSKSLTAGEKIVIQSFKDYWNDIVNKCVAKDASDGLDCYVVEREAEGTGRMMLALSMFPPKITPTQP